MDSLDDYIAFAQTEGSLDKIIKKLSVEPYFLQFYWEDDRYIIFCSEKTPMNRFTRSCNGLIFDRSHLLLNYSFDRFDKTTELTDELIKQCSRIEELIDGDLIRVYFYRSSWCISTTRSINPLKAKWKNGKTFLEMFVDASGRSQFDINTLEKGYSHSFVMIHPENIHVTRVSAPKIYYISSRNLSNYQEVILVTPEGTLRPSEFKFTSASEVNKYILEQTYEQMGLLFISDVKYPGYNPLYANANNLKGNYSNPEYQCLRAIHSGNISEFLEMFPELTDTLKTVQKKIIFDYSELTLDNFADQLDIAQHIHLEPPGDVEKQKIKELVERLKNYRF